MKTVESKRKAVRHLANNQSTITICGLLREQRWIYLHHKSRAFFDAPRIRRCETCTRIAARALDRIKVVT